MQGQHLRLLWTRLPGQEGDHIFLSEPQHHLAQGSINYDPLSWIQTSQNISLGSPDTEKAQDGRHGSTHGAGHMVYSYKNK